MILAVDHNPTNLALLAGFLARQGFATLPHASLEDAARVIAGVPGIELALVDIAGFGSGVWCLCERLKQAGIPFLLVSLPGDPALQMQSLAHGACGVLVKPLAQKDLARLLRRLLAESHRYEPHTAAAGS